MATGGKVMVAFRASQGACLEAKAPEPANAPNTNYVGGWEREWGFSRAQEGCLTANVCVEIKVPANAYLPL